MNAICPATISAPARNVENLAILTAEGYVANSARDYVDFEALRARWIADLDVSPRTAAAYDKAVFGSPDARNVRRPARMPHLVAWLAAAGTPWPSRADILRYRTALLEVYRPATVRLYMTAARRFLAWAARMIGAESPAEGVKGGTGKVSRAHAKDALTATQCQALLAGVDRGTVAGRRDYALLLLAITSGLRTCELARAQVADLRNQGGARVLAVHGKGRADKGEIVAVAPEADRAICDYLAARGRCDGDAPLFAASGNRNAGGRMAPESISRIVKTALRRAGMDSDRLTAHSLRHTCATLGLQSGAELTEIQQLLRHASISTTQIYLHEAAAAANTTAARVAAAIL